MSRIKRKPNLIKIIIKFVCFPLQKHAWPGALPRGIPPENTVGASGARGNTGSGAMEAGEWGEEAPDWMDMYIYMYVYAGCPRRSLWVGKRRCIDYDKWLTMIKMEDYDKKLLTIIKSELCMKQVESEVEWLCEINGSMGSAGGLGSHGR